MFDENTIVASHIFAFLFDEEGMAETQSHHTRRLLGFGEIVAHALRTTAHYVGSDQGSLAPIASRGLCIEPRRALTNQMRRGAVAGLAGGFRRISWESETSGWLRRSRL